jgi:DamX protein
VPQLRDEVTKGRKESKTYRSNRAAGKNRIKDTAWIWSRNPANYAVQLAAARNEQLLETRMREMSLPGDMAVVQTLSRGQRWYVLIFGDFSNRESARRAIDDLPESLQRAKPWPRSFASLQEELSRSTPAQ